MNKKIVLSAMAFAIMAPASIVFAKDDQQIESRGGEVELRGREVEIRGRLAEVKAGIETENEQNKQQKRLEFQDKKEKMLETQCKNIEKKISTRVGRYENNGKMLEKVYGNMQTRLTRLVARLDAAGADTAKLKADILILNGKIDKLKADQATFMATLKDSQSFVCGKSEGEFKGKLEQARKVPEIIKQDREDIKNFFQTTIKADLQAIRTLLEDQKEIAEDTKTPKAPKVKPTAKAPAVPAVTPVPVQ